MPADRWRRIEEIFEEVAALSESGRAERLAALCGGDEELQREVASLLEADSGRLSEDLDNVVLMALRKEPQRRYASVELLSEDLRRYREGMPVRARPSTLGYRAARFVGRHRLGVGLAAGFFLLILGLAVVSTVQAVRLARQRDEIRRERDKAVEVARLLEEVFAVSDPSEARGQTVTARELLDQGAALVQTGLKDQPEVQAALAATIGEAYRGLGLLDRAQPLLERSLELRRRIFGEEHPEVAESQEALGVLAQNRGELDRAEALHRQALATRRKLLGSDDPAVAESLNSLATAFLSGAKSDEAGRPLAHRGCREPARRLPRGARPAGRGRPPARLGLRGPRPLPRAVPSQDRGRLRAAERLPGGPRRRPGPVLPEETGDPVIALAEVSRVRG